MLFKGGNFNVAYLNLSVSVLVRRLAVDSTVVVLPEPTVVLQNVEDTRHLGKNQDPGLLFTQLGQKFVQDRKLPGVVTNVFVSGVRGT